MNRRSSEFSGYINFPIHSDHWKNTNEGGMFVYLIAIPSANNQWSQCCGGKTYIIRHESFIKDDFGRKENYYFSNPINDISNDLSIPLFTSIIIGSTGWSGFDGKKYWYATYFDLTDEGKILYHSIKKLYEKNATIRLITFLDT